MKLSYKIVYIPLLALILFTGCDRDKFADINTDPSTLKEPNLHYSMTKAIEQMYRNNYTIWFYNYFQYIFPWTQLNTFGEGNHAAFTEMGVSSRQGSYTELFGQVVDVRLRIDAMSEDEKRPFQALRGMTYPIQIYPILVNTDNFGSLVYSEAGIAMWTTPPVYTPVLDSQEDMFDRMLEELDSAIESLMQEGQVSMGNQDFIYNGRYSQWAKFCNLLKLKIAARLVNADRDKAKKIAEEVANSPAGYMDALEDDFIYNKGINAHGTGNYVSRGYLGRNFVEFMVNNRDPRLRCIVDKNDFNGEVVQTLIDEEKDLPPYVEQYVDLDAEGNFSGWLTPGEPWVRYHGVPISPDEIDVQGNSIYFNAYIINVKVDGQDVEKSYWGVSPYCEKVIRTTLEYTYPISPYRGSPIILKGNEAPLHVILGSSAETNLYLAEFKLLGANLPKEAQEYFNQGVRLSVERMDQLAKGNALPYYESDPVYSGDMAEAAATKLRDGEIDALLGQDAYDLTTDGLEKVYIQQYINFAPTPGDLWALVRRSGIPKKGSSYFAWENFTVSGSEVTVPRRFVVDNPADGDLNYQNKMQAITEQGFTPGTNNPEILSTERLWFDKNNPEYGAGPIQ